jgi:hypothetical protein
LFRSMNLSISRGGPISQGQPGAAYSDSVWH